uniref:WD_REPEATS_REGION domain-containing protein n=1 Tax=Caenorhabditis tropicalis TaxID=1561998 RepID=A0A1I7V4Q7_9PELO
MSFTNIKDLENLGIQKICIDSSGTDKEFVYVCDSENKVLKFDKASLVSEKKPTIIEISDATTSSIAWHGDKICFGYRKVDFLVGSEQQLVGLVKKGNFDADEIAGPLEFQMEVTAVDVNEETVVAGSSDYAVKCTNLKDPDAEIKTRSLDAEILCVKLDPRNEYVAVSTVDGNVTIINIDSFSVDHTLTNVFPKFESIDVSRARIQMSWSKDGKWLFIPSEGCVKSFLRRRWEESGLYRLKNHENVNFSITTTSQCGKYLAASSMDNQIAIWDSEELDLLTSQQFKRNAPGTTIITDIEFSPFSTRQLIIADSNKGICMFTAFEESASTDIAEEKKHSLDVEDSDDDSIILNRTSRKKENLFDDEAMDDDEETRMSSDIGAIKKQYNFDNPDIGALEEFGFNVGQPDTHQMIQSNLPSTSTDLMQSAFSEPAAPRKMVIPERFICNSTPADSEVAQRFLKYNRFGTIRSYVNEVQKISTIDIEFHDKSIHGDIHIDNFEINYELADISMKVVALASVENRKKEKELDKIEDDVEDLGTNEPPKEKKGTSILHVIPVQAFDGQRWTMTLPRGDGCIDVLCSNTQVVILTKKRNIRVFTIGGIQRQIFTHFAPILTATCFDDRIAIASVVGSEFYEQKKTPQWRFEICEYSMDQKSWYKKSRTQGTTGAVSRVDVPVETGEQLDWVAYSSQGKLAVMDSAYNVHVLSAPGFWVPIFQGSTVLRGVSDSLFPVGLTDKEFRYIYCRGSRTPVMNGVNAPTTVAWKVPFCQPESLRTDMEHTLFIKELALADTILEKNGRCSTTETAALNSAIVKLFAWFAKANSDGLAAEVASLAATIKPIQMLCNYASKLKKVALAEKVAEIGRQMTESNDDRTGGEDEIRPTKRIALATRKVRKAPSPVPEDQDSEDGGERNQEDIHSRYNTSLDVSMSSQPVQSLERLAKNPFAKGAEGSSEKEPGTQTSLSIFDQLETVPVDQRKRAREVEPTVSSNPTARKQAKLKFGSNSADEHKKKFEKTTKSVAEIEKENEAESPSCVEKPVKKRPKL